MEDGDDYSNCYYARMHGAMNVHRQRGDIPVFVEYDISIDRGPHLPKSTRVTRMTCERETIFQYEGGLNLTID